jgi:hypothetical protein
MRSWQTERRPTRRAALLLGERSTLVPRSMTVASYGTSRERRCRMPESRGVSSARPFNGDRRFAPGSDTLVPRSARVVGLPAHVGFRNAGSIQRCLGRDETAGGSPKEQSGSYCWFGGEGAADSSRSSGRQARVSLTGVRTAASSL